MDILFLKWYYKRLANYLYMKNFPLYGFCFIVSASLIALLSMSTDFVINWVNDIVIPCQHDSVWTGTSCNCGNSRGVYDGIYCDECQCEHQGICGVLVNGNSRWGCRCASHTKWTGTLCDNCYTENKNASLNRCSGPCVNTTTHQHSGPKCDTVCVASASSADDVCREISSGGGVCNACNGHGTCTPIGQCECEDGWFNTIGGEQCALSCADVGINCNSESGICQSVGGQLQCVCEPGYYGTHCDQTCGSVNDFPCSGHGTCSLTPLGAPVCTCDTHYRGSMCQYECPGDKNFPTSCSGHGECVEHDNDAVCVCDASTSWMGFDCSCNAKFTCSGHGSCQPDATCECNDWSSPTHQHWSGGACQKCQDHWYGRECHLRCDPDGKYTPDVMNSTTDGLDIGCNGFGTCELFTSSVGERVKCSCRGTDPSWFCAKCESSYYPLTNVSTATAYCTTECNEATCSYRGVCNNDYDGTNDVCICDKRTVGTVTFDTIDPERYCSVCKENWYPGQMDSPNACTHYCAADGNIVGTSIVFGTDRDLQGDIDAQKVCVKSPVGYSPDPDCRVCSGEGTCRSDGECACEDGHTGIYCEIDCGQTANGQVCSGHGRCIRNDLDMWFDPFTTEYRCECQPYDTYTAETRQRLIKNGVSLDPPVSPNYYGKYCEFHCPRYNEAICSGRGECTTGITVPEQDVPEKSIKAGQPLECSDDDDCKTIPGAFCAQLSSPWDSLSGSKSFFSSGPSSPGYLTCAASQDCLDSIYSIAWDDYCVSMLNGWYPSVLNTATCTYHTDNMTNCRTIVEDYFIRKEENKTWCQAAMEELSPLAISDTTCNKPANEEQFEVNKKLCFTWKLASSCSADVNCIYDKTYNYMQALDVECASLTIENERCLISVDNGRSVYAEHCSPKIDGSECEAKTYCRAKTCKDAISEHNIESLCIDVEPACTSSDKDWAQECTKLTGQIRPLTDLNVKDTFFSCIMYERSINPQQVSMKIPGAATIYGSLGLKYPNNMETENIPIQEFRQNFLENRILLDDRTVCGKQLSEIDFSTNEFCSQRLQHVIPSWVAEVDPSPDWFQEYMVYCSSGIESLWTQSSQAVQRIQELQKDCTVQFKCKNRLNPNWNTGCPEADSDSVYEKPWRLTCLGLPTAEYDKVDWSLFPRDVSACTLTENVPVSRWGESQWSLHDIEEKFSENCESGLRAPWIPEETPIPTICTLGACADGHECVPCSEETMECNSGVICIAKSNINCFEDQPCQNGGQCYQPFYFEASNKYLCEWDHAEPVIITVGEDKYNGVLTSRDELIIYSVGEVDISHLSVEKNGYWTESNVTTVFRRDGDIIVPRFSNVHWMVRDVCADNSRRSNEQCLLNASTWLGNTCLDNSGRNETQCLLNASRLTVPVKVSTPVLPPELESCTEDDDFNWYKFCASQEVGQYLTTSGENGLIQGWSGTHNLLLDDRQLLLTVAEKEINGDTLKITLDTKQSEPGAGLALTVGDDETFWYIDDVLPYTNYIATLRLNQLEIQNRTNVTPGKLKLQAMFGKRLIIASIKINGVEQLVSFKDSLISPERQFYMETATNVTNYDSWSFTADGSATIIRHEHDIHPPTKQCTFTDNRPTCSEESTPPPNGIRWPLVDNHHKRIHGWTKIQETNQQTANMVVSNSEFTPIVDAYIYQKRLYVNGLDTKCRVTAHEWWHWTFDVQQLSQNITVSDSDMLINEYVIADSATTVFNSTWSIDIVVDDCHYSVRKNVLSTADVLTTHHLMGTHFHDIANQEEHECLAHCHAHAECQQWSWTPVDQHCFLHSEHCTTQTCTLGTHSMNSFHPRGIAYLDIWSRARKTRVSWNYLRVEDLITDTPFTCSPVNIQVIPPLWQAAFAAEYKPLTFDTTSVCNQIASMWEVLPGYNTYNCEGKECEYVSNDMQSCAAYMEVAKPDVSTIPDCLEEKQQFLSLDWTSYCRYERSFHGDIPFLGGRVATSMESMCNQTRVSINAAQASCSDTIDIEWFNNCFERTSEYENFCHTDCIEHIENMLDDGGDDDRSICAIRQDYLDISDIGLDDQCDCTLDNMIITDFCTMQDAYHEHNKVKVPELYNSKCSRACATTLQDSMDKTTWRQWCSDLSMNKIPGTCSKTVCECDQENIGVAGTRCELTCPSGIDDGQELACSGRNGRCFAVDATEIVESNRTQLIAGEYRDTSFEAPTMPVWQTGPTPTADGRCQCALGSGLACSIPCDKCNNGTYGSDMASQYGICDSFNGICRGLAPWMRYNVEKAEELQLAYNSTSFESALGTAVWTFPERFMYESDAELVRKSLLYMNDKDGFHLKPHLEADLDQQDNIKILLQVFEELCWDPATTNFDYLSNTDEITMRGLTMSLGTHTLKQFTINGTNHGCTDIAFDSTLTLCYNKGKMFARDGNTALIVMEPSAPTYAEGAYIEGMTFAVHPDGYVLTFGGEWDYGSTQTKINTVYKIDVTRVAWDPRDIVFLEWHTMPIAGTRPPNLHYAPIYSFLDTLYLLTTVNNVHDLYQLELPTPMNDIATWSRVPLPMPLTGGSVRNIDGNNGQLSIYLISETWIYTPDAFTPFIKSEVAEQIPPFGYNNVTSVRAITAACSLELVHEADLTKVKFGGRTVLESSFLATEARIYIEEWTLIDLATRADITERFHETVSFALPPADDLISDLTQFELSTSLDYIERIYMHQARWSMSHLMYVKYMNQNQIWPGENRIQILAPSTFVDTEEFERIFDSLSLSYFQTDIDSTPNYLNIFFEVVDTMNSLVIQGNYLERKIGYKQYFYIGKHKMELSLDWDTSLLRVRLQKKENDGGRVEWFHQGTQSFLIVLPLEKWLQAVSIKTTATFTSDYLSVTGRQAIFSMFVSSDTMQTHSMLKQTSDFLSYSSSHCSVTAGKQCPGFLPYINLPCSGRGRCNIACQCVCEVAPSVLQSVSNALQNINAENSPYRGHGCEITCPGFDGHALASICSGIGLCQYDGSCSCPQGYTGDACQFKCPIDDDQNICSAHGGCGTKATESSSFIFTGDNYMDTITATNKKNYALALASFYNREHCAIENYVSQTGSFHSNVAFYNGDFNDLAAAIAHCEDINSDIRQDITLYNDEEFREYPYGMCVGIELVGQKYLVATLLKPTWRQLTLLPAISTLFQCEPAECSFEPDESNDNSIRGLRTTLLTPSFEIKMNYVHGQSSGTEHYKVNGMDFLMKSEWTPRKCKIEVGYGSTWTTIVNMDEHVTVLKVRIETDRQNNVIADYKIFRNFYPSATPGTTSYLAPLFETKYVPIIETLNHYILIRDGGPFVDIDDVEYACDMLLACTGIIQWDLPYKENYFTLYSDTDNVVGFEPYNMVSQEHVFLKKMSKVYQGAESALAKCDTIDEKRSKYPTVEFEEIYDIPIENIDLSLAQDDVTPSVIIGSGLWSNCWVKGQSTTKVECYNEAYNNNSWGFAFSDDTEDTEVPMPVCLIYYKITDQTKIKLGRYNSEARRTLFHPCNSETTYWRPS